MVTGRRLINSLKVESGMARDKEETAEELNNNYFSSLVGVLGEEVGNDAIENLSSFDSVFRLARIEEDVLSCLRNLDPNKAIGTEGITAKILRTTAAGISRSLTSLFNASLRSGEIPKEWKSVHVTAVHKGGDAESAVNYRPVSWLSSCLRN